MRIYKEFEIYTRDDEVLPEFCPFEETQARLHTLRIGDYVETEDGFITPIVKKSRTFIRVAAKHGKSYVYKDIRGGGKRFNFLTAPVPKKWTKFRHKKFRRMAWEFAKTWDWDDAYYNSGYAFKMKKSVIRNLKKKVISGCLWRNLSGSRKQCARLIYQGMM